FHIITCWNLPFWVAQWYQKSVHDRPMPASIAAWSTPLPPEEWAQPSAAPPKCGHRGSLPARR
ncbi:MAG: hypothetical protein ACRCR1_02205, partial [Aeromonas sp.]